MKVYFAEIHNIVIKAESSEDRLLLKSFIDNLHKEENQLWLHGYVYTSPFNGITSFNFGYNKKPVCSFWGKIKRHFPRWGM